jgi:Tol biopolymer transport system component
VRRLLVPATALVLLVLTGCGGGRSPVHTTSPSEVRSPASPVTSSPLPKAHPDDIAYVRAGHIWRVHSDGSEPCQVTSGPGLDGAPAWSPDRAHIAFVRSNPDNMTSSALCVVPASGGRVSSWSFKAPLVALCYSPDGRRIVVAEKVITGPMPAEAVGVFDTATGTTTIVRRLHDGFATGLTVSWSPDGSRLLVGLFRQDASGQRTGVLALDSGKLTWLPVADAYAAHWSATGHSIVVDQGTQTFTRVSIADPDGAIRKVLLRAGGFGSGAPTVFDGCYSPDGSGVAYCKDAAVWTVGVDGYGARLVTADGAQPVWASR